MSTYHNEKSVGTKVFMDTFKGHPTFGIWKIDERGAKVGKTPVICFGQVKAKAILDHIDEIQSWVEEQESNRQTTSSNPIDLNSATPEQLQQLQLLLSKMQAK